MSVKDKLVLCISGFDPCAGAGMLADVKAVETTGAYAMGVITANTIQTEDEFISSNWVDKEIIKRQLTSLLEKYRFKAIKIGIIEDLNFLINVIDIIREYDDSVKIVWDPVLKSSSGHGFHSHIDRVIIDKILLKIDLITPNLPEYNLLFDEEDVLSITKNNCALLLKGGHSEQEKIIDNLFVDGNKYSFEGARSQFAKHGTGCVLSSLVAGSVANEYSIVDSCERAKEYMNIFIESDKSLLGRHNYGQ